MPVRSTALILNIWKGTEDCEGIPFMKTILGCLLTVFVILNFGCISDETEIYIEDLKSENVMVRNNAIYYLGKNKEESAVPMLIELLNNHQPKETMLSAIDALGKIEEGRSVDALVSLLKEKDDEIRIAVVEALGKIRDPKASKPLINILSDKDVQRTAIRALGSIGDKSAVPALTKLLDDPDEYVSYNAAQALKQIGSGQ